jgi:hypothetical protein
MATILTAGTTTATSLVIASDTSGTLAFVGGTGTAMTIASGVVTLTTPLAITSGGTGNNTGSATQIANTGGWAITPTGTKLYFSYNGTNVASMDSSGNFKSLLTTAAGTTP